MQRYDFYFRQKVTEGELDAALDAAESAINNVIGDLGAVGVTLGGQVTQHSPTPNLSVDLTGPCIAYDQQGRRIYIAALQNPSLAVDENSSSTTVAAPGNEKWLSLFLKFDRALTDPRLDGDSNTVFYNRAETFSVRVVQGAEASIGTASRPALRSDQILLADVKIVYGQTQVLTADVSTTRTQYSVVVTGSPNAFGVRTQREAVQELEDQINDILNGIISINASSVDYAGGGTWADATTNPATTVELQLDKIITDLAHATTGAAKVGFTPATTWANGNAVGGTNVRAALDNILTALADSTGLNSSGAARIGFTAQGGLVATNVEAALLELDNEMARKTAATTFTNSLSVQNGFDADAIYLTAPDAYVAGSISASPGTRTIVVPMNAFVPDTDPGTQLQGWILRDSGGSSDAPYWQRLSTARPYLYLCLESVLMHRHILTQVEAMVKPGSPQGTQANRINIRVKKTAFSWGGPTTPNMTTVQAPVYSDATNNLQVLTMPVSPNHTITRDTQSSYVMIEPNLTGATGDQVVGVRLTVTQQYYNNW